MERGQLLQSQGHAHSVENVSGLKSRKSPPRARPKPRSHLRPGSKSSYGVLETTSYVSTQELDHLIPQVKCLQYGTSIVGQLYRRTEVLSDTIALYFHCNILILRVGYCVSSLVTIESTGSLRPEVLFTEAVKILEEKCERVISELS